MARRDELLELLRPPAHRGPLIAAGAVVFTVGLVLEELRLGSALPRIVHVLILALAAALFLGLGLRAERDGGAPGAPQSVVLVCGLLLLGGALLQLADVLGADVGSFPAGTIVWTSLVLAAAALYAAVRCDSAICTMIAGLAGGIAVLAAADWILGADTQTAYRWLLLALAVVFALGSLVLRGRRPRHAELMVVTGALATLTIVLLALITALVGEFVPFGAPDTEELLPGPWELVVLVAGCGLVAYGAVDRAPGAAWLGVAHLAGFVVVANADAGETLLWWPLLLLLLGAGGLVAGLRPRTPLPPEPAGYSVERPVASRSEEEAGGAHADGEREARDTTVVRVRNDEPPSR
jgi:hypothetical protein